MAFVSEKKWRIIDQISQKTQHLLFLLLINGCRINNQNSTNKQQIKKKNQPKKKLRVFVNFSKINKPYFFGGKGKKKDSLVIFCDILSLYVPSWEFRGNSGKIRFKIFALNETSQFLSNLFI